MKRSAINKRNGKRHASEWTRAYGSRARVLFVKALSCRVPGCEQTPSQNVHACGGGASRKADARSVLPLCQTHHTQLHQIGARTFEEKHGIDLLACAEWTQWRWEWGM